jgi:hypothetical protein
MSSFRGGSREPARGGTCPLMESSRVAMAVQHCDAASEELSSVPSSSDPCAASRVKRRGDPCKAAPGRSGRETRAPGRGGQRTLPGARIRPAHKGRDQSRPLHGTRCVAAGRDGVIAGRGRRHLSVRGDLGREALDDHVQRRDQLVRPYLRTDGRRAGQDPPLWSGGSLRVSALWSDSVKRLPCGATQ